jgi:hypothetical protein
MVPQPGRQGRVHSIASSNRTRRAIPALLLAHLVIPPKKLIDETESSCLAGAGIDKHWLHQARPHSELGYRTPEEFAKNAAAGGCGKDGGRGALENASRFQLSHSRDGCGNQPMSAMLETQNQENVSSSLD